MDRAQVGSVALSLSCGLVLMVLFVWIASKIEQKSPFWASVVGIFGLLAGIALFVWGVLNGISLNG